MVGSPGRGATFIAVKNRWRSLVTRDKGEAEDKRGQRGHAKSKTM